jgi:hypothetical protein
MSGLMRLRTSDVEWREIEGEVVALDLKTSRYLATNRSGAHLWNALVDGATREDLIQLLVAAFAIPTDQAASDTDAFVAMLTEQELLVHE